MLQIIGQYMRENEMQMRGDTIKKARGGFVLNLVCIHANFCASELFEKLELFVLFIPQKRADSFLSRPLFYTIQLYYFNFACCWFFTMHDDKSRMALQRKWDTFYTCTTSISLDFSRLIRGILRAMTSNQRHERHLNRLCLNFRRLSSRI